MKKIKKFKKRIVPHKIYFDGELYYIIKGQKKYIKKKEDVAKKFRQDKVRRQRPRNPRNFKQDVQKQINQLLEEKNKQLQDMIAEKNQLLEQSNQLVQRVIDKKIEKHEAQDKPHKVEFYKNLKQNNTKLLLDLHEQNKELKNKELQRQVEIEQEREVFEKAKQKGQQIIENQKKAHAEKLKEKENLVQQQQKLIDQISLSNVQHEQQIDQLQNEKNLQEEKNKEIMKNFEQLKQEYDRMTQEPSLVETQVKINKEDVIAQKRVEELNYKTQQLENQKREFEILKKKQEDEHQKKLSQLEEDKQKQEKKYQSKIQKISQAAEKRAQELTKLPTIKEEIDRLEQEMKKTQDAPKKKKEYDDMIGELSLLSEYKGADKNGKVREALSRMYGNEEKYEEAKKIIGKLKLNSKDDKQILMQMKEEFLKQITQERKTHEENVQKLPKLQEQYNYAKKQFQDINQNYAFKDEDEDEEQKQEKKQEKKQDSGKGDSHQHSGITVQLVDKILKDMIIKDFLLYNVFDYEKLKYKPSQYSIEVFLFLYKQHFTIGILDKKQNEIVYFDSLSASKNQERLQKTIEFFKDISLKNDPELTYKFKYNSNVVQKNTKDDSWKCGVYSIIFATSYIDRKEPMEKASEFDQQDEKEKEYIEFQYL